jgi:serine/threonine protein kinase
VRAQGRVTPDLLQTGMFELPRGSVVGKYEIMRRLAIGGMAEIYLARVTGAAGFEKLVVLKRILPSVAEDPTFVTMFLDEAKLAATLRHPNIADVYDVGEDAGTYFFTMEYVYGQDVRAIRHDVKKRAEPIPLAFALAVVHGTASALDHAHEKLGADGKRLELVHRDVSASNIMVSYDGAVKLLDFGIARAASSTHKTQTGTLKGKIPYMSPEQCKGLPLDRRSDLFSLGVVLYELTVGKRPFRGETDFAIMDQIVYQGAKPPSEVVSGYPPELEAIVMKLLARGPSMRYATGEDLLHDLDEFIAKHGLWLSARAIGKYMRTLFADKIAAWEQAEQEGVPFAQYVAHSITSQSQRSELLTPPSQFPGVGPRTTSEQMAAVQAPIGHRSTSEEIAAVHAPIGHRAPSQGVAAPAPAGPRTSKPMPAMQPLIPVTPLPLPAPSVAPDSAPFVRQPAPDSAPFVRQPPPRQASPDSASFERQPAPRPSGSHSRQAGSSSDVSVPMYPALRPRSSRTILLAFIGALVLGAGGVLGYMVSNNDKPVAAESQAPTKQMDSVATEPAKVEPVEPKPQAEHKTVKTPTVPAVDTQPTVPDHADVAAKDAADRAAKEAAAKEEAARVAAKKASVQTTTAKKPIVQRPPRVTKPKNPPPVKPSTPKQPKEQTWDPNSPFLPQ